MFQQQFLVEMCVTLAEVHRAFGARLILLTIQRRLKSRVGAHNVNKGTAILLLASHRRFHCHATTSLKVLEDVSPLKPQL